MEHSINISILIFYLPIAIMHLEDTSKELFIDYACEIHTETIDYLSKIFDDSLSDVTCPWRVVLIKIKQEKLGGRINNY